MTILKNVFAVNGILEEIEKFSVFPEDYQKIRIKNAVLQANNILEGMVNLCITRYYFDIRKGSENQANHFWINILSTMDFAKKINVLKSINIFSEDTTKVLYKINDIRNDVAHYPHRIHKRNKHHLRYDGMKIYEDFNALLKFHSDFEKSVDELSKYTRKFRNPLVT